MRNPSSDSTFLDNIAQTRPSIFFASPFSRLFVSLGLFHSSFVCSDNGGVCSFFPAFASPFLPSPEKDLIGHGEHSRAPKPWPMAKVRR